MAANKHNQQIKEVIRENIDSLINSREKSIGRVKQIVSKYDSNYEQNIRFFKGDLRNTALLKEVFFRI